MTITTTSSNSDGAPPFLPLEEASDAAESDAILDSELDESFSKRLTKRVSNSAKNTAGKRILTTVFSAIMLFLFYDSMFRPPEDRFIKPDEADRFLRWVLAHPSRGIVAFVVVIASAVILLIPVGTPLTIGCGFVYKSVYGWRLGVLIATVVSMSGSICGAVTCFLLGRYLMRDHVKQWIRKYPLFVAIDIAAAEHGLKILAMLYLTPIAPLGPMSYMAGTTSMSLTHFCIAKIASLPIMILYVFIGASAGALVAASSRDPGIAEEARELEENPVLILCGLVMSVVMISAISYYIKKELYKILERQKKFKPGESDAAGEGGWDLEDDEGVSRVEMGVPAARQRQRHRVQSEDLGPTTSSAPSNKRAAKKKPNKK